MPIGIQKKIWWSLLFTGFGGTVALSVQLAVEGIPRGFFLWCMWPAIFLVSGLLLIRCYKIEPTEPLGFWHLGIQDLLAATLLIGTMLAAIKVFEPAVFLGAGIPFAVIYGVAFMLGALTAARAGVKKGRLFFAFSSGTRLVGFLGLGAMLAVMFMEWNTFGDAFSWVRVLLYPRRYNIPAAWVPALHPLALMCLPVGLVCYQFAKRVLPSSRPRAISNAVGMEAT